MIETNKQIRDNKITNVYGIKDIAREYISLFKEDKDKYIARTESEETGQRVAYSKIIDAYLNKMTDRLLGGRNITLPYSLGAIETYVVDLDKMYVKTMQSKTEGRTIYYEHDNFLQFNLTKTKLKKTIRFKMIRSRKKLIREAHRKNPSGFKKRTL